jgi:hypothetical protein
VCSEWGEAQERASADGYAVMSAGGQGGRGGCLPLRDTRAEPTRNVRRGWSGTCARSPWYRRATRRSGGKSCTVARLYASVYIVSGFCRREAVCSHVCVCVCVRVCVCACVCVCVCVCTHAHAHIHMLRQNLAPFVCEADRREACQSITPASQRLGCGPPVSVSSEYVSGSPPVGLRAADPVTPSAAARRQPVGRRADSLATF